MEKKKGARESEKQGEETKGEGGLFTSRVESFGALRNGFCVFAGHGLQRRRVGARDGERAGVPNLAGFHRTYHERSGTRKNCCTRVDDNSLTFRRKR
jgi:hypothetical protein